MSVLKAIEFSANAHLGYFRKGSRVPYITHPFEVAKILAAAVDSETNEALICAGLLHDTVEDTETTMEIIQQEFGTEVAALVASDSEDKTLSWEKRKKNTIDFLENEATRDMQLLACADKLANLRSIKKDYAIMGDEVWNIFVRGKEKQAWYYKGVLNSLKSLDTFSMYREFNQLVQELFD
ncbi:HD domain-containing protein [Acetobacterium paludosum]|uniref:HD domain-containing protein n=1 Tax=Acetobacterium paludosum TaxID=52693 RepID=A0A923KXP2_9FIRM|nr:HD domain-containing protein [Acetobacterium paludosum]MBC3889608.1 HD domain-containing protein [Acetobacterium paludosum]